MFKSGSKKILVTLLSTAICATILVQTVSPAFAANELNPKYILILMVITLLRRFLIQTLLLRVPTASLITLAAEV